MYKCCDKLVEEKFAQKPPHGQCVHQQGLGGLFVDSEAYILK